MNMPDILPALTTKVLSNGTALHVVEHGAGAPVLLVHGFPDDHTVWRRQIPALVAAGYRVIALDTAGCGESEMPSNRARLALPNLVADLLAVLDHLEIAQVRLVAHDWGALIAWHFCMAHPERVDRFVALSVGHPNAYLSAPLRQKLKSYYIFLFQLPRLPEWLISAGGWRMLRMMSGFPQEAPRWIETLSRPGRLKAAIDYYRANFAMVLPRRWPKVGVSVMGVWSDRDIALCREQMERSAEWVTGTWRFECVVSANHWLQLDAAPAVSALLLDYLEGDVR